MAQCHCSHHHLTSLLWSTFHSGGHNSWKNLDAHQRQLELAKRAHCTLSLYTICQIISFMWCLFMWDLWRRLLPGVFVALQGGAARMTLLLLASHGPACKVSYIAVWYDILNENLWKFDISSLWTEARPGWPSGYWQANDSGARTLSTPQPQINQPAEISSRCPFLQLLGLCNCESPHDAAFCLFFWGISAVW